MVDKLLETDRAGVLRYYNKTDDDIRNDINSLYEWFKRQPHLPKPEENKLEIWLLHNKFSLEKTKRSLEMYYTVRNLVPELYGNWDVLSPQIQMALDTIAWLPLPKLTSNLDRISIFKLFDQDPNKFNPWEVYKVTFLIGELRAFSEYNIGEHIVYDLEGFKFSHLSKLTPTLLKKVFVSAKEAYAVKIHGIHVLNAPPGTDKIIAMAKPIVTPKIFDRIHVHKDLESFQALIPKEFLPKDYGGDEPPLEEMWAKWLKELERQRSYLIDEIQKKADESRRIGEIDDSIFGSIHGSFRQLQVD